MRQLVLVAVIMVGGIGNHQQTRAHVSEHHHSHGGIPKNGEPEKYRLDAEGQPDVLLEHRMGTPGQANGLGNAPTDCRS